MGRPLAVFACCAGTLRGQGINRAMPKPNSGLYRGCLAFLRWVSADKRLFLHGSASSYNTERISKPEEEDCI